jgi:hypothetical protein
MTNKGVGAIGLLLVAVVVAGCGGGQSAPRSGTGQSARRSGGGQSAGRSAGNPPAFAWLNPAPPPSTWQLARLSGTAALAYPPSWHRIRSDPGTATAAVVVARTGLIAEYLNVTPKQANETLQNWATFRTAHNRDEGDTHEQVLAAARDLRFRDGHGSCVIDSYNTIRTRYQEIACLVQAPAGETVIVAAGLAAQWSHDGPALERAVSAFMA